MPCYATWPWEGCKSLLNGRKAFNQITEPLETFDDFWFSAYVVVSHNGRVDPISGPPVITRACTSSVTLVQTNELVAVSLAE